MNSMHIGMVGLGRMGSNMVQRLLNAGHSCVAFDIHRDSVEAMAQRGAVPAYSLEEMVQKLEQPRTIWLMVPAAVVQRQIDQLCPLLEPGDCLIDGGNSFYQDDIQRSKKLAEHGIRYLDVGTSGGVWGLERGYCLMIGGDAETVQRLQPIFEALAPGEGSIPKTPGRPTMGDTAQLGYLHCGPSGSGHFVKMVHNGIEYGIMAAYAEGLNVLHGANCGSATLTSDAETAPLRDPGNYRYDFDIPAIAELWRRGSVVSSWLLDLTAQALAADPDLSSFQGKVSDSGEGRWTVTAAIDEGVPVPVLSAALFERFSSQGSALYADRLLSAMRFQFGGHREKSS